MTLQKTAKVGQNLGQSTGKTGEKSSPTNPRLKKMSNTQLSKGPKKLTLNTRPPVVIDLNEWETTKVDQRVLARGVELKKKGRVHQNPIYPWRFVVSGDQNKGGANAYLVDLSQNECSCLYSQNSDLPCKHVVAALLIHMETLVS